MEVVLRTARRTDAPEAAEIFLAARAEAMPYLPDVHTDDETRAWIRDVVALLARVKELRPGGFRLWVFQRNTSARRFYEERGLRLVELTDGAGNEEREPDALYEWRPEEG